MVQVPLAAKVEGLRGQLLVCPKSPGLVPVKPMLVMVNAAPLGFESVTALAALVVFTLWFPNDGSGEGERLGSNVPVPDTAAVWGLLPALSVAVNVALRVPVAVGVKVTLMVQVPLAAKVEGLRGQLLVCPKSPGLVPVKLILVMDNAAAVGFESFTARDALAALTISLPNDGSGEGERLGRPAPVPVTLAVCGLLLALSVTVNVALRAPIAVGVNVTSIEQLAPAARLAPQLFVCAKSPLLVPVKAMLVMLSAELV